jgi:hypothetical protein
MLAQGTPLHVVSEVELLENRIQLVIGKCSVPQAACVYSLIRPLRTGFRGI